MVDDEVIKGKTRSRRLYASYYTESTNILNYMVDKLQLEDGDRVLEPCAGNGAFIADIFDKNYSKEFSITAYDLNPKAISNLAHGIKDPRLTLREADTLTDIELDLAEKNGNRFNKIIGNPPYGAWQDVSKRKLLKEKYGGYAKETYTLFLQRCISLLETNGRLVFIIPDTFLGLNMHKGIRELILNKTYVEEIALFPSKFFPGVNFGYSNLSIITLRKSTDNNSNIKILSFNESPDQFEFLTLPNYPSNIKVSYRDQNKILQVDGFPFHLNSDKSIDQVLNAGHRTLGDLANCVTGFYSGDNQKFLYTKTHSKPSLTKYKLAEQNNIHEIDGSSRRDDLIKGLENETLIPIHKGGKNHFIQPTEWYLAWSHSDVEHYNSDSKARFQNSKYYFTEGLAVPMVRSKRLKATLLERRIFDQSVVGIFPLEAKNLNYIWAFLNSETASKVISAINHTANNSANYLKKLPIIIDDSLVSEIESLFKRYEHSLHDPNFMAEINTFFKRVYTF